MADNIRRLERERVLSLLYEAEMKGMSIEEVLDQLPIPPEPFVIDTVKGVSVAVSDLDAALDRYAIDWKTERMASVDLTVLRIGAWELINRPELPVAVIISEAVELAKRFSTDESGKFVNGVLAAMSGDVRGS